MGRVLCSRNGAAAINMQSFFQGYAINGIDAKNRVSIPSGYRDVIESRSNARTVVLALHEHERCLIGYDLAHSARLYERLDRRFGDDFGTDRDDLARLQFGMTEQLGYDDNGRIVLSPMLKELGELERLAFFIANGDTFEIWNPDILLETKCAADPRLARIVKAQIAAKGGKA